MSVGVVIITHNARHHLPHCLPPLIQSPIKPKILLVNSSSTDGTVELAKQFGVETAVIPRKEFNHGATREWARKKIGTDIVVMITPDAYAQNKDVLTTLIRPIVEKKAVCAYAKQIPHHNADLFETFPRDYNYPETSHIRSIADLSKHGVYTFFFSDSFGAYLNSALDEIGGFTPVLTGEDTVACAKLLHKGHKVAYVAEARVHHSHRYSLKQEFKRHFDTGLARNTYRHLIASDTARGKDYVKALFKHLVEQRKFHLIPYAFFQCTAKWLGYKIGEKSNKAPLAFKKLLSSQDFYWNSIYKK